MYLGGIDPDWMRTPASSLKFIELVKIPLTLRCRPGFMCSDVLMELAAVLLLRVTMTCCFFGNEERAELLCGLALTHFPAWKLVLFLDANICKNLLLFFQPAPVYCVNVFTPSQQNPLPELSNGFTSLGLQICCFFPSLTQFDTNNLISAPNQSFPPELRQCEVMTVHRYFLLLWYSRKKEKQSCLNSFNILKSSCENTEIRAATSRQL